MCDLVGNPEDQFSHNEAQFILLINVKMPTIVLAGLMIGFSNLNLKISFILAISIFISSLNFMLS